MTASDRARVRRIAEGIVTAHAGYRRRVRWAIAAGALVAMLAVLPSLLLLNQPRDSAAASGGGLSGDASRAVASRTHPSHTPETYRPDVVIGSNGAGAGRDYATALRRWRPYGVIRVYRASTTPAQRTELRVVLGPRVHFVDTRAHAAVLQASGTVSLPPASSTRGSSS
jgi:hypothetical protein